MDIQLADWRERALDKLLTGAWEKYVLSLETGQVLELEAKYESFVAGALDEVIELDEVA